MSAELAGSSLLLAGFPDDLRAELIPGGAISDSLRLQGFLRLRREDGWHS